MGLPGFEPGSRVILRFSENLNFIFFLPRGSFFFKERRPSQDPNTKPSYTTASCLIKGPMLDISQPHYLIHPILFINLLLSFISILNAKDIFKKFNIPDIFRRIIKTF
jgi:hypothetical protein